MDSLYIQNETKKNSQKFCTSSMQVGADSVNHVRVTQSGECDSDKKMVFC